MQRDAAGCSGMQQAVREAGLGSPCPKELMGAHLGVLLGGLLPQLVWGC
jgi:hypothetical protein